MRFNSSELKLLSESSDCVHEGPLTILENKGKFWNKNEVLNQRWCRIVGNILFCMKTESKFSEASSLYVLEGHTVEKEEGSSFAINFLSDEKALFIAPSLEDADLWIKHLQIASYSSLKNKYRVLLDQLEYLQESSV